MSASTPVAAVDINGIALAFREWGEGSPSLLLLHGYMGSSLDWIDVAPGLAHQRRVVAYDHRGHGDSGHLGLSSAYTFDALAADLEAFVDAGVEPTVDLLGHSMGGVVAMMYVLAHPERVRSMVLMDTAAAPAGNVPMDILDALVKIGRDQGMAALAEVVADFAITIGAGNGLSEKVIRERAITKISALDVEAVDAFATELNTYPSMVERLGEIRCPVTVIVGERDEGLRASADVLAREIGDAELIVVEGASHSPQEDRPQEWTAAVLTHLERAQEAGGDL